MTIIQVAEEFMDRKGLKINKNKDKSIGVFIPLFAMDIAKSLYDKYIVPSECKFELKKLKNQWAKAYHEFNMFYFHDLDPEQTEYVIDIMDRYEEFIERDNQIYILQGMNAHVKIEDRVARAALAAANVIGVMTRIAVLYYDDVIFKGTSYTHNRALDLCERVMDKWQSGFFGKHSTDSINLNDYTELVRCMQVLCNKQELFINQYKNS